MILLVSLAALGAVTPALAVDTTWTAALSNDFYNPGNWDTGAVPTGADDALILNPTVTAVINFTGAPRELGTFHLGGADPSLPTGGNVDFSSGELVVHAEHIGADDRAFIGNQGSADSKFVMRGSAVMLYDEPLNGGGGGFGSAGDDEDLEIGARTGATGNVGVFELHDNAVFRITDDLKIGAETDGNGEVLIDGNATITAGSGISVSEANPSKGKFTVAGNALVVSGNSAGAGNTAQGFTNEGYLTLSVNSDSTADMLIKDSARVYARTLQQRNGVTNMTIQDDGQFHVFEAFSFAAPNLGVATVVGNPTSDPVRASQISGGAAPGGFNLVITGHGKMSIDSALDDGAGGLFQGLALAGGSNTGLLNSGATAKIELRENASFVIQQNLYMTPVAGDSTLRIVGPNVEARVNGNLYMSYDPISMFSTSDPSTLAAVITGNTHSTLNVGGQANIEFGNLAVELSGYSPVGGETYTLISAGSISGANFLNTDFSMAPLAAGLSWDLDVNPTSVVLKVLGSVGVQGDFDGDQDVDGNDFLKWQRGESPMPNSVADLNAWKANFGDVPVAAAAQAVPEPCSLWLAGAVLCVLGGSRMGRRGHHYSSNPSANALL